MRAPVEETHSISAGIVAAESDECSTVFPSRSLSIIGYAGERVQSFRVVSVIQSDTNPVRGGQRMNELGWCCQGDDLAQVHDCYAIAQVLGFLHIVSRQDDSPPLAVRGLDELP